MIGCCCSWIELIFVLFLVILILPLIANDKIRYYSCYVNYVVTVSTLGSCLVPIFALRPRNPVNLVLAGNTIKHLTRFLRIEWEVRGGERFSYNRENEGSVVLLNHQSIFDIMGLFNIWNILGKATVIAKQELLWVPPFGPVAWLAGLIYIDRKNPKEANTQIHQASKQLFKDKVHLCVFPEGTRNKEGKQLLPFKNGAFRVAIECQTNIIPVVLSPYYFIDAKNKAFQPGKVIVSVLEPIETKGMTLDDLDKLKEKAYDAMSQEYQRLGEEVKILQLNHNKVQ